MNADTVGRRIVAALRQLEQFIGQAVDHELEAIDCLTGARVVPFPSEHGDGGILLVQFPGGEPFKVNGHYYLRMQVARSVELEFSTGQTEGNQVHRFQELIEHLSNKHKL